MVPGVVALLAEPGAASRKQRLVVRSVGFVTGAAILTNRLMLPQEGATFLGMAFVAGFIDGVVNQAGFTRRTVRLVTIATGHQANVRSGRGGSLDRVARLAHELGALFCVAGIANHRLGFERQHRVVFDVQIMTVDTGDFLDVMHAAHPVEAGTAVMAGQADRIFLAGRYLRSKSDCGAGTAAIGSFPGMGFAWAVTGLATVLSICHG